MVNRLLGGLGVKQEAFVTSLSALGLFAEGTFTITLLNRLLALAAALSGSF